MLSLIFLILTNGGRGGAEGERGEEGEEEDGGDEGKELRCEKEGERKANVR